MVVSTTKRYVGYPPEIPVAYREWPWMVDLPIKLYQTWFSVPVRYVSLQWPEGKWSKNRETSIKGRVWWYPPKGKIQTQRDRESMVQGICLREMMSTIQQWITWNLGKRKQPLDHFFLSANHTVCFFENQPKLKKHVQHYPWWPYFRRRVDNLPRVSVHLFDC